MDESIYLANVAAGIAIEHIGCAKITLKDLSKRLLEFEVDNKFHRYYPDVIADIRDKTGKVTKYIIEIKPHKQTLPPQKPMNKNKKRQERYTYEMVRWIKNNNKWIATVRYCKKHGYEFKILTEKHIFK